MMPLIVTAAIIRRNQELLITRRPESARHGGLWEFPGGKLQKNESPEQALRREILEELALPVEVGEIFSVTYHRYDWGPVLILAYDCLPLGDSIQNLQVTDHRWVTPHQLLDYYLLPADRPIVDKLLSWTGKRSSNK